MSAEQRARFLASDLLVVTTDLEPDDLFALWLLAPHIDSTKQRVVFLVGEGCAAIKRERMRVYAGLLGFKNHEVLTGFDSKKDFPDDGKDVLAEPLIGACRHSPSVHQLHVLTVRMKEASSVSILSLKPMTELLCIWETIPNFFANTLLAGYMSFNVRACLSGLRYRPKDVQGMLASFKEVIYYETFHAVGADNTIAGNKGTDFEHMPSVVTNLVQAWNAHILEGCYEKVAKDTAHPSSKARSQKIIDQIGAAKNMQMVNADCGLVWALLQGDAKDFKRGHMVFDPETLYSSLEEGAHNTYLFHPADKETVRLAQIAYYNSEIDERKD